MGTNEFNNKVVAITGADGGLGRFVTCAFLNAGARVAGISNTVTDATFNHPGFVAVPASLDNADAASGALEQVTERLGRMDAVVHLVGGFAGGPEVEDTDDATFDRMIDANLRSAFYVFRAAIPKLREQGAGRILAVASRAAAHPRPGLGVYAASKAGLVSLIQTLALENRQAGVTANVVLPGTMDTPANRAANPDADPSKWVQPRDVASLLAYLASDAAAPISGAVIPIYGSEL